MHYEQAVVHNYNANVMCKVAFLCVYAYARPLILKLVFQGIKLEIKSYNVSDLY